MRAPIRRVLETVDAAALDAAVGSWLAGRPAASDQRPGHGRRARRALAVDGKTNEITAFAPLLEPLNLAGCVIAADTMHTQREHARFLISEKKARYNLVVKKNQPSLYAQVKNLPGAASRPVTGSATAGTAASSTAPSRPRCRRRARLPPLRPGHPRHPPDPALVQHQQMAD
jgi:hypothetical protein